MSNPAERQILTYSVPRATKDLWGPQSRLEALDQLTLPSLERRGIQLRPELEEMALLSKAVSVPEGDTGAGVVDGIRPHLIDKWAARKLRNFNTTHAACLSAAINATVGLGHRDQEIHEKLDPLCMTSWQDVLDASTEDLEETGDAYIECVFDDDLETIVGIHHVPAAQCYVVVEERDKSTFHYEVQGEILSGRVAMAPFLDLRDFIKRSGAGRDGRSRRGRERNRVLYTGAYIAPNSAIISWRQATNRSKWYGYPRYMSAVPSMELDQCMVQHEWDFYHNRGVPELLLFLVGNNISPDSFDAVKSMLRSSTGLGNSHKSGAIKIDGSPEDVHIQLEKLAMEGGAESGFETKSEELAMRIATAHGTPLELANIHVTGAGANAGPNSLLIFQKLVIGKNQRNISNVLARTLGNPLTKFRSADGEFRLTSDQFKAKGAKSMDEDSGMPMHVEPGNGFASVLDGMNIGATETLMKMREPLAGSSRNPADGILTSQKDRSPGDARGRGSRSAGTPRTA